MSNKGSIPGFAPHAGSTNVSPIIGCYQVRTRHRNLLGSVRHATALEAWLDNGCILRFVSNSDIMIWKLII
jgi:hypothetical protein